MKTLRPYLSAALGLTLLVQGFAVTASVPVAQAEGAPAAAEMPCHGDGQDQAPDSCPCCDGDCPNMTSCLLGHLAGVPRADLQFTPAAQSVVVASPRAIRAGFTLSRLRPPIPFHA